VFFYGCANTIETRKIKMEESRPVGSSVEGIVYYKTQLMKIQYGFTAIVNDKGELLGTAENGKCRKIVQKEVIKVLPNYGESRVIINKPSGWNIEKFSVTIK
jgi:hypothetical protein